MNLSRVIELTGTLIIIYLVVTNASGFSRIISASASGYTAAVKALQGR